MPRRKIEHSHAHSWANFGEKFEGVYEGERPVHTRYGDQLIHRLKTAEGGVQDMWGTAILNSLLGQVEIGATVEVEYIGEAETNQGNAAKLFDVYVIE